MASDGEAGQVVVVGVDGSDPSIAALSWAGRYGAATGAVVWALHIWHYPGSAGLPPGVAPPQVSDEVKANQRKELDEAMAKANLDPAAQVESKIGYGHPAQVLIEESKNVDLLVLGYKGHGGFTGMLTGSVSLQVVHHAECPVVVVRGG
jgi:nucleotide-binding universal stress UspA family protein